MKQFPQTQLLAQPSPFQWRYLMVELQKSYIFFFQSICVWGCVWSQRAPSTLRQALVCWLAQASLSCFLLPFHHRSTGLTATSYLASFTWALGFKLKSSCLLNKRSPHPSISPSPSLTLCSYSVQRRNILPLSQLYATQPWHRNRTKDNRRSASHRNELKPVLYRKNTTGFSEMHGLLRNHNSC